MGGLKAPEGPGCSPVGVTVEAQAGEVALQGALMGLVPWASTRI
jgi:hypothetical protein